MRKLLLILAVLSIPAIASAYELESEAWVTFCENGTEKVRASFVTRLRSGALFTDDLGEFGAFGGSCDAPSQSQLGRYGTVTDLGGGRYLYVFVFNRANFGTYAMRDGPLWFFVLVDGSPESRYLSLRCADGPQPIVDNSDCTTLPVASKTWGAIKALYQPKGGKP